MPNTLAHIGLQVIGQRVLSKGYIDIGLVLCGCAIPDLPWILRRVVSVFDFVEPLTLFAYSSIQSSLLFSVIFAAAVSFLIRNGHRAFVIISVNCALHLTLDALQIKWANGVILFAPINWQLSIGVWSGRKAQ